MTSNPIATVGINNTISMLYLSCETFASRHEKIKQWTGQNRTEHFSLRSQSLFNSSYFVSEANL